MDIQIIEQAIGLKTEDWKGECYFVSCLILNANLIKGRAVHGSYFGTIAKASMFYSKNLNMARHGWIETPDGKIIDPTRWVFEDVEPYIYETTINDPDYDKASSKLRKALMQPQPEYNPDVKQLAIPDGKSGSAIRSVLCIPLNRKTISVDEAFWMANLTLDSLNFQAEHVYNALIEWGFKAFIPADHQVEVFEMKMWSESE
jgi:hypothetical protein